MAKYEEVRTYSQKSADECFQIAQEAVKAAGLEVWKTRPFAWLVMSKGTIEGDAVDANVMARPGGQLSLTISANKTSEEELKKLSGSIFAAFEDLLK